MMINGLYTYKYMNGWERFNKTLLLDKKEFYSNLIEDITDESYNYARQHGKTLN